MRLAEERVQTRRTSGGVSDASESILSLPLRFGSFRPHPAKRGTRCPQIRFQSLFVPRLTPLRSFLPWTPSKAERINNWPSLASAIIWCRREETETCQRHLRTKVGKRGVEESVSSVPSSGGGLLLSTSINEEQGGSFSPRRWSVPVPGEDSSCPACSALPCHTPP